jgi:hypothetical protein
MRISVDESGSTFVQIADNPPIGPGKRFDITLSVDSLVDDGCLWDLTENALDDLFAC